MQNEGEAVSLALTFHYHDNLFEKSQFLNVILAFISFYLALSLQLNISPHLDQIGFLFTVLNCNVLLLKRELEQV